MTESEFVSELDDTKLRARNLLVAAVVVMVVLNGGGLAWLTVFRGRTHSPEAVHWGMFMMLVWAVSVIALFVALKKHTRRGSPKCPTCHQALTWQERARVLASKECPFCHARLFSD